jgi:hypothetical protein
MDASGIAGYVLSGEAFNAFPGAFASSVKTLIDNIFSER